MAAVIAAGAVRVAVGVASDRLIGQKEDPKPRADPVAAIDPAAWLPGASRAKDATKDANRVSPESRANRARHGVRAPNEVTAAVRASPAPMRAKAAASHAVAGATTAGREPKAVTQRPSTST